MMKRAQFFLALCICSLLLVPCVFAEYEVVCREKSVLFVRSGKVEREAAQYELFFLVDEEAGTVRRTKLINLRTKEVFSDNSVYQIVHLNPQELWGKRYFGVVNPPEWVRVLMSTAGLFGIQDKDGGAPVTRKMIKAVGRVGTLDGYETLVIGDTFVDQSKSTLDYFVIAHSDRLKKGT